ncbi:MAG: thioredoxin, partial [Methyloprofundus sp.]|nr:thioredoxin [Methyloprofundus sp.]
LQAYQRFDNDKYLAVVEASLHAMAQGGIYDQVAGGFHRYATDRQWQVPHFEKMLYNQAQLAQVYLLAHQLTGKAEYARIARQTLDYVLNDMRAPAGGFYSATDADSNGKEGEYFVWTVAQIQQALPAKLAQRAIDLYGVTAQGNFEGHNILHLSLSIEDYAQKYNMPLTDLLAQVTQIRTGLKRFRQQRVAPLRDDKIVTAWNAMLLESLVLAAEVLDEPRYLTAAITTANWLWQTNRQASGELWRIHWQGSSSVSGNQQDYAFLASAFIKLYDQTGEAQWLNKAQQLTDNMLQLFWDSSQQGFFMNSAAETAAMMVRPKGIKDNALASANGVAATVLAQLAQRTADLQYANKANATLSAFSAQITQQPTSYTRLLMAAGIMQGAELGTTQYAANGAVIIRAKRSSGKQLRVDIKLKPGWHINTYAPLQKDLIATKISLLKGEFVEVNYPSAIIKKLSFGQEKLALYEHQLSIQARLPDRVVSQPYFTVQVQLQACNDKHCLAPEMVTVGVQGRRGLWPRI